MQLGFQNLDEEEQKKAKKNVDFHRKTRTFEGYLLLAFLIGWIVLTGWMGIKAISDRSYLSRFLESLIALVVTVGICVAFKYFLDWLFSAVFKSQNTEKLPKQSRRSLRNVLNYMNGNIALLVWEISWGIIVFSALLVVVMEKAFRLQAVVSYGSKILLIFLVGYVLFHALHKRRDLTKRLLQNTVGYYNYGDGKLYAEYVDWSIRENLLLCCKQYVLTKEFFLGYAHTDIGFCPVAIPREFVKEAEVRMALSADSKTSVSRAILACKLCNGKVINFYLSRFQGSYMAVELLHKHGFEFTVRNDVVEYR
ncbi:MAG: hypothetical protein IJN16_06000 [Lachnospiraceae bacterium]|nr:hypothetical protein [Lachnospiraceae bacterium]